MRFSRLLFFPVLAALAFGAGASLRAQENHPDQAKDAGKPRPGEAPKEGGKEAAKEVTPPLSITEHTVTINGKPVKYKVTAGYLVLKEETERPPEKGQGGEEKGGDRGDGGKDNLKPTAKVFFVAYTVEGNDPASRPVTFAFNGGPGAASVWLHLGALGPRRVKLADNGDG
ncbi:MAG TPA: hypothetical protein VGH90_12530, partial [Chthoniobacteraceae bacterium]